MRLLLFLGIFCLIPVSSGQPACSAGACVFAGPRIASFDSSRGALSNALFTALLGSNVDLALLDWNALAAGELNLAGYLDALALNAGLSTPEEVLTSDLTVLQLIQAAATVAEADGNTALVSALDALSLPLPGLTGTLRLADLLKLSFPTGSLVDTRLNVLSLVTGLVQLYNYDNVLTTRQPVTLSASTLGALGLGGLLNGVELFAQVVEPPIYTCGGPGTEFYSAAIRVKLNLDLVDLNPNTAPLVSALTSVLNLVGLNVQASIGVGQLELYVDVARAQGVITLVDTISRAVSLQATPGVASLYLGRVDDSLFYNRDRQIGPADVQPSTIGALNLRITALGLLPIDVTSGILARAAAEGEAPFQQSFTFAPPFPKATTASSSATFTTNLLNSLVSNLQLELSGSLGLLLDPLVNGTILPVVSTIVRGALTPVLAPMLAGLVDPLLETLGIRLGEVDITVFGVARICTLSGVVYQDANRSGTKETSESWVTGLPAFVNTIQNGRVTASVEVSPGSGVFAFAAVPAGDLQLIVTSSAQQTLPQPPAGFTFINPSSGSRTLVLGAEGTGLSAQDFGLALIDPGALTLNKAVRNLSRNESTFTLAGEVIPDEVLEYQLVFRNPSSRAVSSVTVSDVVPLYTKLEQNVYGVTGEVALTCPDGHSQVIDVGAVNYLELRVLDLCGVEQLLPGAGGELRFQVRVQ